MHATKKPTIQPKQREPRVRQFAMIISLAAIGCGTAEPAGTGGVAVIDAGVTLGADTGPTPPDVGPPPGCDQDGDGFLALECDGNDCDDRDRSRHPEAAERCSFVDENCSGENNERLDCTFFAHGRQDLYRIDPFLNRVTPAGTLTTPDSRGVLDIDRDPNGRLIGVTREELLSFDERGRHEVVASIDTPANTNGLAIDSTGRIYLTQSESNNSRAYTVSQDGDVNVLGNLDPYRSSGDCVVLKDDSLLMTAPSDEGDLLVYVDSRDATPRVIGSTGFIKIYGLSASFGYLFGTTDEGRVLLIDANSGEAEELFRRADLRFWGAANGD